jgi:hypothetical protein
MKCRIPIQGRKCTLSRCAWEAITGEWWFWIGRPNGGTVIFFRTLQITAILYVIGLTLQSILLSCSGPCELDLSGPFQDIGNTVPWLGATFGAVYAALYARFASQWSYLAGVYNQMRQTLVNLRKLEDRDGAIHEHVLLWRAGFIEDALDLHLATKGMFGPFLRRLLEQDGVRARFERFTFEGRERADWLAETLKDKFPDPDTSEPSYSASDDVR